MVSHTTWSTTNPAEMLLQHYLAMFGFLILCCEPFPCMRYTLATEVQLDNTAAIYAGNPSLCDFSVDPILMQHVPNDQIPSREQ